MSILPLILVALIGSTASQELFNDDYSEDGAVQVIEDDPAVPANSDSVVVFPAFVDEGEPLIRNMTYSVQDKPGNVSDTPLVNGTKDYVDLWTDEQCGYLMLKFLALGAVLLFVMIVILLVWYSCSSAPHEHKFPTKVVLTPSSRATPGRNYSRVA